MKAGVMLADFTPSGIAQPGLFDEIQPRKNSEKLMKTLDELNQSGKGKVWFAGRGTAPEWQMKREMLGNDSNLLIVFYVQIMPDDFVMQLHRF